MKFCEHCGKEIMDEAVICLNCGCVVNNQKVKTTDEKDNQSLKLASGILCIISCVYSLSVFLVFLINLFFAIDVFEEENLLGVMILMIVLCLPSLIFGIIATVKIFKAHMESKKCLWLLRSVC